MEKGKILFAEESYTICNSIFNVYKTLGCGFLEAVYQEALEIELRKNNIPFASQVRIPIFYDGVELKQSYQPDLVCYDKIIVELKAVSDITDEHRAQLMNYLKATGFKLGLLVNFGNFPKVEIERFCK